MCACEAAPPPAAPRANPQGVEMIRVDPAARARWNAIHAPGLEGTRVPAPPTVLAGDEQRLRATVHAEAPVMVVPMRTGVAR